MREKIYKIIEKVGPYKAATYFGGVERFLKLLKEIPGTDSVAEHFVGSCGVSHSQYPEAMFDFTILDLDKQDSQFGELTVDMLVDFSNLSGEEIYNLKQWMGAVADDFMFDTYDLDESIPTHVNLVIKSFNGRPYNWPGYEGVISDDEAFELLDKTGLWEGLIRESIQVFKNPKTDEDSSYKKMVAVIKHLENKPGNSFTDYTDLDPTLKIKYLESEENGIVVYIDTESLGVSDEEFEIHTPFSPDEGGQMSNENIMKYYYPYRLKGGKDTARYKTIIHKRLEKLRKSIGLKDKLRITIRP